MKSARRDLVAWIPPAVVVLAFLAARVGARGVLGLRFDWSPLTYFLQYPPVALLREDLLRSTASMHHQAPLPSLIVGTAMKLSSEHWPALVDWLHCALALVLALAMLDVLKRLGVGPVLRTIAVALYTASPVVILYEMWCFYHQLVAAVLVVATWCGVRYAERATLGRGLALFGAMAFVAYCRSIYGGVWFVAALVGALAMLPAARKRTLQAAALPLLLVIALPLKTKIQTGGGYGDALLWPNLSVKVFIQLPTVQRERLVREGKLSKIAPLEPFIALESFERAMDADLGATKTGVRLLDERVSGGQQNKQHLGYLELALRWSKPDAQYLLREHKREYVKSVLDAVTVASMRPSTNDLNMGSTINHKRLIPQEKLIAKVLGATKKGQITALLFLAPAAVAYGISTMFRRAALVASQRPTWAAIAFATTTIVYTSLSTAMVSYADFSRYRFEVDALYAIVWVVMAHRLVSFLRTSPRVRGLVVRLRAGAARSAAP